MIAGALGIGRRTFYTWLQKGEEDYERGVSSLYRQFYEAMEESRSLAETEAVKGILEAGKKQWQALAWFLERRYPERWGLKKRSDDSSEIPLDKLVEKLAMLREQQIAKEKEKEQKDGA